MSKNKLKLFTRNSLIIIVFFTFFNCSKDSSTEPPPPTVINITVKSIIDSSLISDANVVLYNANSGESLLRSSSGSDGIASFSKTLGGSFYVRIAAQEFKKLPAGDVSPVPFSVSTSQTYSQTYYLDTLQGSTFGTINGNINPVTSSVLVVATSTTTGNEEHTYSGPDGYFVLFNVPYGSYEVNAIKSGYLLTKKQQVTIAPASPTATVELDINQITGSTLTGRVTFLSVVNGIVDISLLDRNSLSVITGLTTRIDSDRVYTISGIPDGDYTAWASYENDGYVMDPDWIFKNPGALNVTFSSDTTKMLDFSVTNTISIISPTNPDELIIPALADSIVPTFSWNPYPQAKEYIIEVRDINGNLIWGGFKPNGEIRHTQIPKEWNSVEFNFDGSALTQLQHREIYQWKIYADDDDTPNVQTLLSSSEDLKGLFITP
jgi:hypothetical protein